MEEIMNKKFAMIASGIILVLALVSFAVFNAQINLTTLHTKLILIMGVITLGVLTLIFLWQKSKSAKKLSSLGYEKTQIVNNLEEQRKLVDSVFKNTNVGIALVNLDGHFFRVNKALSELLGYSESELLTKNFYQLIYPLENADLQNAIEKLLENQIKTYRAEQECYRKNGDNIWIMSTLSLTRDEKGDPIYFIIQIQDITLQKKAEERLRHMAYHDPLTGLANRNKLEQFVNHILASAKRHQQGFALLFLDLDRFKNINDTIGHEAGDLLLQIIAERLRNTIRSTDMVARLGGDEFVLVITDVKKTESIAQIAQKILDNVLQVIVIKGQEIYITTSIGISFYPYDGSSMQALMKNADLALYRAKEHGRNNYQFYTVEMTSRAQEKMAMQNALGHALAKNEFFLNYQPKMNLKNRSITGIEALLRWKNKEYGMISPDEIVALAEETGLIIPVSEWVLKTACQQLKLWHQMGLTSLTVAVNCSSRQFKQSTFVDDVLRIITEADVPRQSVEIEITESTIMQDPENTLRVLYALKDAGVQIAIDDFGTGYWSLSNLRRLSVDKIKIDKSFIKQITIDETSSAITSAIIGMANRLGITSIAEGVETKQQYDFLAKEGCTEIQGYYLTRPLSSEAIIRYLQHPIPDAESITKSESSP